MGNGTATRAVLYCRVSTPGQAEEGASLETHAGFFTFIVIFIAATSYAFHRRDQYPGRDLGFWRHFVQHDRDRKSALKRIAWMMCGAIIGSLIAGFVSLYNLRNTSPLHAFVLRYPLLLPLALVAAIIITIMIWNYWERRNQA